jgi:hypothetical protein
VRVRDVSTVAEVRAMQGRAKEYRQLLLERAEKHSPLEPLEGVAQNWHLDFRC